MLRRAGATHSHRWNYHRKRIIAGPVMRQFSASPSSSSLLGHSPMAQEHQSILGNAARIPSAKDAEISGVWQTTTAKRDKLGELRTEATDGVSLDEMATETQKLDLYLVDGLQCVVKYATKTNDEEAREPSTQWIESVASSFDGNLHEVSYNEMLSKLEQEAHQRLSKYPPDRCLRQVDDFFDPSALPKGDGEKWMPKLEPQSLDLQQDFTDAVDRFRLQYLLACIRHMQSSWATWTTLSDQEVDRLAVEQRGEEDKTSTTANRLSTIPKDKIVAVLQSYLQGSNLDQFNMLWKLMDHDDDGLLDQQGMEQVCKVAVSTAQASIPDLFQDGLNARRPLVGSWLQRRRQKRHRRELEKDLQRTIQKHFDIEVELNHRLRCIYAWSNKKHQDNKIDSVVVEAEGGIAAGVMGRKRYVELHPKISLEEFREVQSIHFPQIDEVATEYMKGFREELLVRHGRGRQRQELIRDGSLFFTVVCLADYIILSL